MYYGQIVTEGDLNDVILWEQAAEKDLARDIAEGGVFEGMLVTPRTPVSTSVEVSEGVGRIVDDGSRIYNSATQVVSCTVDEFGMPTFSDLLAGEGRWCSLYVKFKSVNSDLRTDGHGLPVWFTTSESLEFFLHIAAKGLAINKSTLTRPGTLATAILLADIWFEAGSTPISAGDIDVSRREDYFRQTVGGIEYVEGNPRDAAALVASLVDGVSIDLLNPDLPTGAADGAHRVGLGGTASQAEFQWAGGNFLDSFGDNVHMTLEKIVSDLGNLQTSGSSGSHLISHNITMTWFGGVAPTDLDSSIGGALEGAIFDLSGSVGSSGADKIGSRLVAGAPYALVANSVQTQISTLLGNLNTHVLTAGHPASAITCPLTVSLWADGSWLITETLQQRFESLVLALALKPVGIATNGTSLIGCGANSATVTGETVTLPGNVSLDTKITALLGASVGRVNVTGDARLTGNYIPLNPTSSDLGSLSNQFRAVYAENIGGGNFVATAGMYIVSEFDLELFAAAGCNLVLNIMGGSDRIYYNGVNFAPANVASIIDLGANTRNWRNLFISGDIRIGTPVDHFSVVLGATGDWDDSNVANRMTIAANGENCTNGAIGTRSYHQLTFLKDGMNIDLVEIEWFTAAVANMTARILRLSFGALPVVVATIVPTAIGVKHITTSALAITGNTGNGTYILEMQYNVAIGSRFYQARFRHYTAILDY
jgi:hypothetical protein